MRNIRPLFYLKGEPLRSEPEDYATFALGVVRLGFGGSLDKIYYLNLYE
jgi:hypothetical protein